MSVSGGTAAALAAGSTGPAPAWSARDVPGGAASFRAGGRGQAGARAAGWWRAWRVRFGLAEVCGTLAAVAGFAVGYVAAGSLLAAAALATLCEAVGFYGCVGAKTAAAACRATAHLAGWRRLAAGTWHAVTRQLASCAAAEALDGLVVRPGCLAAGAWLARPLPGGVWLGFAAGKAVADVAWYGIEASARRGVARSFAVTGPATPYLRLDVARAVDSFAELADFSAAIRGAAAQLPYPVQLACEPGRAIAAPAGTMTASLIGTAWRGSTLRVSLDTGAFHGPIEALESGRELRFPVTIPLPGTALRSHAR